MNAWATYFLVKLVLHAGGWLTLRPGLNLALALALLVAVRREGPVATRWGTPWRLRASGCATVLALALLWVEAGWPSPRLLLTQLGQLSQFSAGYLAELAGRAFDPLLLVATVGVAGVIALLGRRLRLMMPVLLLLAGLTVAPLWTSAARPARADGPAAAGGTDGTPPDAAALDEVLRRFHAQERGKRLRLPGGSTAAPPFDLLVLSLCSLSWSDLDAAGLRRAPLLQRLDVVFERFNSAATYSGPALQRVLHGACGQLRQDELYDGGRAECRLLHVLAERGYRPALLLNHDGRYDGFAAMLARESGIAQPPEQVFDAPVAMSAFDGSPVRADGEVLSRWWHSRTTQLPQAAHALVYNSISLHDGNRLPGSSVLGSAESYAPRAKRLFEDLAQFVARVEASGRPTVIVLLPEHGAALHGADVRVAGLRELPLPSITHVPAGLMLLGFGPRPVAAGEAVRVQQPVGHLALFALVAALIEGGPAVADRAHLQALADALPASPWVAENEGAVYLGEGGRGHIRSRDGEWSAAPPPP